MRKQHAKPATFQAAGEHLERKIEELGEAVVDEVRDTRWMGIFEATFLGLVVFLIFAVAHQIGLALAVDPVILGLAVGCGFWLGWVEREALT